MSTPPLSEQQRWLEEFEAAARRPLPLPRLQAFRDYWLSRRSRS